MDKPIRMTLLNDFYGQLLTPKQQELMKLHYEQDLSLGEIAGEFHVSRQAVYDILSRAEKTLLFYEEKLGLVKSFLAQQERLKQVLSQLDELLGDLRAVPGTSNILRRLDSVRAELRSMLD